MRHLLVAATALGALCCLPTEASAKALSGRFAIGFVTQFSPMASFSVKYTFPSNRPEVNIQLQGVVGFAVLADQDNRFFAGARILLPLVAEDQLNLYTALGGGYLRYDDIGNGARVEAALGIEWFFFGLDNLGFSAEFGVDVDILNGVSVSSNAGPFGATGIHYYF